MAQLAPVLNPEGLRSHTRSGTACKTLCPHGPKGSILIKVPLKTLGGVHTKPILPYRQAQPKVPDLASIDNAGEALIA